MKFEHYTASGQRIVLRGRHKDNAHSTGGWEEKMYQAYFRHLKWEYDHSYPRQKGGGEDGMEI